MKKRNFVCLMLLSISGVMLALGVCFILLREQKFPVPSTVLIGLGTVLGIATLFFWQRAEKKARLKAVPREVLNEMKSNIKRLKKKISGIDTLLLTYPGFVINLVYGLGNGTLGVMTNSLRLITLSAYYIILSIMRFSVLLCQRHGMEEVPNGETFIRRFSGFMLLVLDIALIGTVYLTVSYDVSRAYHKHVMIAVATYTFVKAGFAAVNLFKSKKQNSPVIATLRHISFADAATSIFSLQSSMLVSFESMTNANIGLLNTLTGSAVCLLTAVLGINLIIKHDDDQSD